jgi:hypothetical protein
VAFIPAANLFTFNDLLFSYNGLKMRVSPACYSGTVSNVLKAEL